MLWVIVVIVGVLVVVSVRAVVSVVGAVAGELKLGVKELVALFVTEVLKPGVDPPPVPPPEIPKPPTDPPAPPVPPPPAPPPPTPPTPLAAVVPVPVTALKAFAASASCVLVVGRPKAAKFISGSLMQPPSLGLP